METTATRRDVGIDACRIVCMIMVLMLHILDASGALNNGITANYIGAWTLEFISYSAVNCYVLISGYVGFGKKHRISKIVSSWFQVFCYAIIPLLVFLVVKPSAITGGAIFKSILPVTSEAYWFFTVYFALMFAMPLLDHLVETMPKKILQRTFVAFALLFSVFSIVSHGTIFGLNYGSGLLWFLFLYCIGAYIKKYDPFSNVPRRVFAIIFGATVVIQLISRLAIEIVTKMLFGAPKGEGMLLYYCNFIILIQAISLLFIFKKYYTDKWYGKIINKLGALSFGVYLFHANALTWANFFKPMIQNIYKGELWFTVIVLPLIAIAIFIVGVAIEWVRAEIFKKCKIDSVIDQKLKDK